MELLLGHDLCQLMSSEHAVSINSKLDIVCRIRDGLDQAHQQGIVRRDMKPANVRGLPDGAFKILDFGFARLADAGRSQMQTGSLLGTVAATSNVEGYLFPWSLDIAGWAHLIFPSDAAGGVNSKPAKREYVRPGWIRFGPPVEDERMLILFSHHGFEEEDPEKRLREAHERSDQSRGASLWSSRPTTRSPRRSVPK